MLWRVRGNSTLARTTGGLGLSTSMCWIGAQKIHHMFNLIYV